MTGAKQIMQAQAVNNHNIANVNTVGFRADAVSFVSQPIYGVGYPTRVNAVASDGGTDFSSGVMQSTGARARCGGQRQGLHRGSRQRRQGSLHARRRSARQRRRRGDHGERTCRCSANRVRSVVPPATTVTIGNDGTVSVVPLGLAPIAIAQTDRIKLVNPPQKNLQKGDDGLLRLKDGSKAPTDPTVTLTSGMLESSNVNAAQSLINMIELQRLYEFQVKA